ncbi:MAG TPA: hypothetical protein VKP58_14280 [Candidatus Acidoferrum sp.]|nr:hypothetical protein [Candidatus Acidoferrum sp.]
MRHYKSGAGLRISLSAIAILIPLAGGVNHFKTIRPGSTHSFDLKADGIPVPPLPPPKGAVIASETLVADGIPVPPLPPPKLTLVADGIPVPPLPPPKDAAASFAV